MSAETQPLMQRSETDWSGFIAGATILVPGIPAAVLAALFGPQLIRETVHIDMDGLLNVAASASLGVGAFVVVWILACLFRGGNPSH